jgi:signal transduction histidine kinase
MRPLPRISDLVSRRLHTPSSASDVLGAERVLAWVRLVLAVSSLLLLEINPADVYPYRLAYRLVLVYLVYALGLFMTVQLRTIPAGFSLWAHVADVIWPTVMSLFSGGISGPFFLYFIFALLAAAFRWGMPETLLTTIAVIAGMAIDAIARSRTPLAAISSEPVFLNFALRSTFALSFAFLIGYAVERERRQAQEAFSISRISSLVRLEAGLKASLQAVSHAILDLFSGKKLLLITQEADTGQVILWRSEELRHSNATFAWQTLESGEEQSYLSLWGGDIAGAIWRNRSVVTSVVFNRQYRTKPGQSCYLPVSLVERHPFDLLLGCAVSLPPHVSGSVLLFDPSIGGRAETQLRFLHDMLEVVAPALCNVYLLRRLRSRAVAGERARLSRELHEGAAQSLQAIAFRLYALRTRSAVTAGERERELFQLQQLVQNEAANVRRLIHELAPLDFEPRELLHFVAAIVTRYREETGIAAQFFSDVSEVDLPPAACREIVGIVREALANVRHHSGAQNVLVRLAQDDGSFLLVIEDDGRGFGFSGRFSHMEREENRSGPHAVAQRVRAVQGELTIISKTGQGARLEIRIPSLARASIA